MAYVTPDDIARAKDMDLLTYLEAYEPAELVKFSGNVYCTREHDSLKISNGKWYWWSRGIGGRSALDYLIKVQGMNLPEAVNRILGRAASKPSVFRVQTKSAPKGKTFILPERYKYTDTVREYLLSRCIDPEIIDYCISTGRIYENHNSVNSGKVFINAVFVGFDTEGVAGYATLRGVHSHFKGEAVGSDKHYSFSLPSNNLSTIMHIFESAIDLLSYATLMKQSGIDWQSENLLSLAGIYQPKKNIEDSKLPAALSRFLQDYPQISQIKLHLDNDISGQTATSALLALLPDIAVNEPPIFGKDVNDMLCKNTAIIIARDAER